MENPNEKDTRFSRFVTQYPVQFLIHENMQNPADNGLYVGTKTRDSNDVGIQCMKISDMTTLHDIQKNNIREDVSDYIQHLIEDHRDEIIKVAKKASRKTEYGYYCHCLDQWVVMKE